MGGSKAQFDYIDPDVAYLIGMIVARGSFQQDNDIRRLVIQFPYRLTTVPGSRNKLDRQTSLQVSLDNIRDRISELLEVNLKVVKKAHEVSLNAVFPRETIGWRDLRYITGKKSDFRDFEVPQVIYESDSDIQKEFLRGIADTSCEPNYADADQSGRQRIVIQVQFGNWLLPIQLCKLLQENLSIPVSHILWGHPNIRAPRGDQPWAKETRIRIFAEAFVPIGFNFEYKQNIFEEMVKCNQSKVYSSPKPCNPKIKKLRVR
ncbi:MAG: hypothetical protein WAV28_06935 [Sedimentisphaerales bacterium]